MNGERFLQGLLAEFDPALRHEDDRAAREGSEVARFEGKGPFDVFKTGFVIALQEQDEGALVPAFRIVRRFNDNLVEQFLCSLEVIGAAPAHGIVHLLADVRRRRCIQPGIPDVVFYLPGFGFVWCVFQGFKQGVLFSGGSGRGGKK